MENTYLPWQQNLLAKADAAEQDRLKKYWAAESASQAAGAKRKASNVDSANMTILVGIAAAALLYKNGHRKTAILVGASAFFVGSFKKSIASL